MIEQELPTVDAVEGLENLERDIRRDTRRRRALIGAAAAAVAIAATGAVLVNRDGEDEVKPAPSPTPPAKVFYFDDTGHVSFVADDGARQTIPAKNVDRAAFSPDGLQVAYITYKEDSDARSLWIADAAGTERDRLPAPCRGCQPGYGVTWSNDGTLLAYSVFTPGKKPAQLRLRNLTSGQEQILTMPAGCDPRAPRFAPDDRTLLLNLACNDGAFVATVDPDLGISSLTSVTGVYNQVQTPSWSADGKTIYFTATTSGDNTNDIAASIDVYAVRADGTDLRQITHAGAGERYFGVTPYENRFLVSRAVGDAPWEVGWLSADGATFTPMKDENGEPVLGNGPQLQP